MIHEVNMELRLLVTGDTSIPVVSVLRYDPADPYAIHVKFFAAGDEVNWIFARDLLSDGLLRDTGQGDVRIWPASQEPGYKALDSVYLALSSPEGEALLELPASELSAFLEFTYNLVHPGDENMIDDEFDQALETWLL